MTPDQLSKNGTEHGHQTALFAWVAVARIHGFEVADAWAIEGSQAFKKSTHKGDDPPQVPALEWFHAIHNQGHGDKVRGANAKAEGVRAGVADTFLPWPVEKHPNEQQEWFVHRKGSPIWHGLYIEMKKPSEKPKREGSAGGVSELQRKFGDYVKQVGYGFAVCYSWREAADVLRQYIEWKG